MNTLIRTLPVGVVLGILFGYVADVSAEPPKNTQAIQEVLDGKTAGATRIGEIASQAVQFAFGSLRSPSHVAVRAGGAKALPCQARPFAYWPDGSIQAAGHGDWSCKPRTTYTSTSTIR